ncbi:MAG TPA: NADH-quinone oxidoreductase subunit N [Candidatus Acidoferrum sp.]|nr:NADH-quinone oxidoreductase subunit N [Candidatus Acidoferrum sp.]
MNFDYAQLFSAVIPEAILAIGALLLLAVDLMWLRNRTIRSRTRVLAAILAATCGASLWWVVNRSHPLTLLDGMLVLDETSLVIKGVILVLTAFTAAVSLESRFTKHLGEYFALLLLAATGMMLLVSSDNLLLIFVALELTSLPLYILTAFNKRSIESAEAALKYFFFGGMAAAFTLFGLSLVYGITGEMSLTNIAMKLGGTVEPVFYVALVMTVIGFAFKVAAAPLHLWAPDAYQGAPTPVAAFIASGSKVASFFVLARVLMAGFDGTGGSAAWREFLPGWIPIIATLAVASMLLGNIAAIAQSSVKRLLAYSAVAHAGYALVAIMANTQAGIDSLLYYVITYAVTALGAFGVVAAVESTGGDHFSDFAGLHRRAPVLSFCMAVFILSLAGIPPLAGFFGKFYVFASAARAATSLGLLWIVIVAIALSCVSLYYYLQVLKQIYVTDAPENTAPLHVNRAMQAAVVVLAIAVVVLGCAPDLLLNKLGKAERTAATETKQLPVASLVIHSPAAVP